MKLLRTPEERFARLPDFPYAPHYTDLDGVRMAHVEDGPKDGPVVLLLHGEPTWSFLYRHMIPPLAQAGMRAMAPDLIGFGRSDKPTRVSDYSYQRHVDWVWQWVEAQGLREITLFCQDWGSLIGLRLAGSYPERFARVVVGNGMLPTAEHGVPLAFHLWRAFALYAPIFPAGRIVDIGSARRLSKAERQAYDAPFPSSRYQAGARAFPALVPTHANDPAVPANRAAWQVLGNFHKPFLTVFGTGDPILGRADRALQRHVPGAAGQPHDRLPGGHFIQEDQGPALAQRILALIRATTLHTAELPS
ncbi:haloalkane dehalogenase [Algiphilus sp.]|uniref:haloalkane dehalogenase n=1 Tax=Algiphilus sp. TaxID=1872431 RepID=UPI003B51A681